MSVTLSELTDLAQKLSDNLAFWISTDTPPSQLQSEVEASRRLIDRTAIALLCLQGKHPDTSAPPDDGLYHAFLRGNTIYWSCNPDLVRDAHQRAELLVSKGWPAPGPINSSGIHPSRLGYAWHLAKATEVG